MADTQVTAPPFIVKKPLIKIGATGSAVEFECAATNLDIAVDQDENTVAFMDINPLRRGHALVMPTRHFENLLDVDPDELANTFAAARRLAGRMTERLGAEGVALWNSCGATAGQVVMHFHVHVIPTDGDEPSLPRPERLADQADIAAAATALRGDQPDL